MYSTSGRSGCHPISSLAMRTKSRSPRPTEHFGASSKAKERGKVGENHEDDSGPDRPLSRTAILRTRRAGRGVRAHHGGVAHEPVRAILDSRPNRCPCRTAGPRDPKLNLYCDLTGEGDEVHGVTEFFPGEKPQVSIARELSY